MFPTHHLVKCTDLKNYTYHILAEEGKELLMQGLASDSQKKELGLPLPQMVSLILA